MNETEAIAICEEYGWDVCKGEYFLSDSEGNEIVFFTLKDLLNYVKDLKSGR